MRSPRVSQSRESEIESVTPLASTVVEVSMDEDKKIAAEQYHQQFLVVASVTFYFAASLVLVFVNKHVLSGGLHIENATVFLTWTQIVVTVFMSYGFCLLRSNSNFLKFLTPWEYRLEVAISIWPVTLSFLGMIIFNNLCLQYVEITFYQVARSLTIVFNIVFAHFVWGESTSVNCMLACAVVVFGYVTGVDGEINFSWRGVFFGAASSCCVSLYSIFVKKYMKSLLQDDSWLLLYYNNVNAMILMPFISLAFGELTPILESKELYSFNALVVLIFAGVLGTLMNIASFFQIKFTSALTHNVSGTAKACVQSILAWFIYRNPLSTKAVVGLAASILGSFAYGKVRYDEGEAAKRAKAKEAAEKIAVEEKQELLTNPSPSGSSK